MFKTTFKAHPIMIFRLMKPYLFVLVLPLIRALVQYLRDAKTDGLLLFEILAVSFVVLIATLNWKLIKITVYNDKITVKKGVLIKSCAVIHISQLSSVLIKQGPIDRIAGSVKCHINTEAGAPQKSDFSLKMYKNDAEYLFKLLYGEEKTKTIRFSPLKIALLSAATSSATTGIFVGVPIINQASELAGIAIAEAFYSEISNISSRFNNTFSPIINVVTLILISAYLFSFGVTFVKNANFKLQSGTENMIVQSGIIIQKRIVFRKSAINNICFEQKPLLRLAKRFSLRVSVGGYGDRRGEKAVIVPVVSKKEAQECLNAYFASIEIADCQIKPVSGLNRFLYIPAIVFVSIIAAAMVVGAIFETFKTLILLFLVVLSLLNIYYAGICYRNYRHSKLCLGKNLFAIGSSGFTIREFYCEKNKIGIIKITKTPADRALKTCKVKFTVCSERADNIRVNNLNVKCLEQMLSKNFDLTE